MTEVLSDTPQSPGSLTEFAATRGYEEPVRALHDYNTALAIYREELAASRGISLEELHQAPLRVAGRLSIQEFSEPTQEYAA